jgi:hypothetical protein
MIRAIALLRIILNFTDNDIGSHYQQGRPARYFALPLKKFQPVAVPDAGYVSKVLLPLSRAC